MTLHTVYVHVGLTPIYNNPAIASCFLNHKHCGVCWFTVVFVDPKIRFLKFELTLIEKISERGINEQGALQTSSYTNIYMHMYIQCT